MLELYTYWSFTLNNPTEAEMVLIKNPNEKYIREFVWTPEVGEETKTPHIQGWIRLQRNNSKAFVIKLYPRASFRGIAKDEYNENTHNYAQKTDVTTNGLHTICLNDPIPNADTQLYKVLREAYDRTYPVLQETANNPESTTPLLEIKNIQEKLFMKLVEEIESEMVTQRANLEKIFISVSYEKMKKKYWRQILSRIYTINNADLVPQNDEKSECSWQEDSSVEVSLEEVSESGSISSGESGSTSSDCED